MIEFDRHAYGATVAGLLESAPLCPLGPGRPEESKLAELARLRPEELFADTQAVDLDMARCCLSGLWLLYDFLDESHHISQEIDTPSGSYWHGIMHRREPDYGNAKYWFRRVGKHPIFGEIRAAVAEVAQTELGLAARAAPVARLFASAEWDAFAFVDVCEQAARDKTLEPFCRRVAQAEWRLLFDFCYQNSIG